MSPTLAKSFGYAGRQGSRTDATYWPWANAQGRRANAANLDFFTSPGRSFAATVRYSF